ncbi:AAA family ATPase [Streptomyces sp. NPDC006879]|uniref:AAA family ATPase n=1 Tax=Streptomyces sp. NPDC006879 TaxID=3364767 RepID=UPI00367AB4DC
MNAQTRRQRSLPQWADNPYLKLAVSGTFSSGKSTTVEALSLVTGIPRTEARTSRELLPEVHPGKTLAELSAMELVGLQLRRFEERVHHESGDGPFLTDGGVFHEWAYLEARMRLGMSPEMPWWYRGLKSVVGLPVKHVYQRYADTLGLLTRSRAGRTYDACIHLPVEFGLEHDGHRPASERLRGLADELLREALADSKIPYRTVRGTLTARVTQITELLGLPVLRPVAEAVQEVERRVRAAPAAARHPATRPPHNSARIRARQLALALRY